MQLPAENISLVCDHSLCLQPAKLNFHNTVLIMNLIKLLLKFDKYLTLSLGVFSPWNESKHRLVYKVYSYILHSFPFILFLFLSEENYRFIKYRYSQQYTFNKTLFVLQIYLNSYFYSWNGAYIKRFNDRFHRNQDYLENVFKHSSNCEYKTNVFPLFAILIVHAATIGFRAFAICYKFNLHVIMSTFRYLISLTLLLQWCLLMQSIDMQIVKTKKLMKSVLTTTRFDCSVRDRSSSGTSFGKIDYIINVYRIAAEKHGVLNDYYGVFIGSHISLVVYITIVNAHRMWYCSVKHIECGPGLIVFFQMITICDLIIIAIISYVSESVTKKVR